MVQVAEVGIDHRCLPGVRVPTATPIRDLGPSSSNVAEAHGVSCGPVAQSTREPAPTTADPDLESFDDYDDAETIDGVPRLHLVDPPRDAPTVIVEAVGDVFEVSRLRDNGTTVACVMWTRTELDELQRRIVAALEMSDVT